MLNKDILIIKDIITHIERIEKYTTGFNDPISFAENITINQNYRNIIKIKKYDRDDKNQNI